MIPFPRTDLAVEAQTRAPSVNGVRTEERTEGGFRVSTVTILNSMASKELCKPIGNYHTITLDPVLRREEAAFSAASELISKVLQSLCQIPVDASALVIGLGNRAITPDAIGPRAMESVLATRHLHSQFPGSFPELRPVCSIAAGVLGDTGIESASIVKALVRDLQPDLVIVVDALACAESERLCRTIQLTDTGITPGSGVGNDREALSEQSLGVPVLAVGVPTVMDFPGAESGLFVTPRNIDSVVSDFSKLIGYAINLALHPTLSVSDFDLLLS